MTVAILCVTGEVALSLSPLSLARFQCVFSSARFARALFVVEGGGKHGWCPWFVSTVPIGQSKTEARPRPPYARWGATWAPQTHNKYKQHSSPLNIYHQYLSALARTFCSQSKAVCRVVPWSLGLLVSWSLGLLVSCFLFLVPCTLYLVSCSTSQTAGENRAIEVKKAKVTTHTIKHERKPMQYK